MEPVSGAMGEEAAYESGDGGQGGQANSDIHGARLAEMKMIVIFIFPRSWFGGNGSAHV
jgi:hypothetical protein